MNYFKLFSVEIESYEIARVLSEVYDNRAMMRNFRKLEKLGDSYVQNGRWDTNYITSIAKGYCNIDEIFHDLLEMIFEEGHQYLEMLLYDSRNDLNLNLAFELRYKISSIMKGVVEQNTAVIAYYNTVINVDGDCDMILDNLIKIY